MMSPVVRSRPVKPVGVHPGPHGVILGSPQRRVADARRALDLVEKVDRHVIGNEQWVVGGFGRIDGEHAEERRGLLLDRNALPLDVLRQLGQCDLNAIVDVDGVDVRIGSELERAGERVAAVIPADALHVDQLVDTDYLRLDRLGNGGIDDLGGCAGIIGRHRDLRRHDIGILSHRNGHQGQRAGNGGDDRDDDRKPGAVNEDRREHRPKSG